MFYRIRPEVPGVIGEDTAFDTTVHPPRVEGTLYYEIDNWFGSDLVTSHPCYLVTHKLADALSSSGLECFCLRHVEIVYGDGAFERLYRHGLSEFPEFRWLFVTGTATHDDVGLTPRGRLIVSDVALRVFRQGNLNMCEVEEYEPGSRGRRNSALWG